MLRLFSRPLYPLVIVSTLLAPLPLLGDPSQSKLTEAVEKTKSEASFYPPREFDQVMSDLGLKEDDPRLLTLFNPDVREELERKKKKPSLPKDKTPTEKKVIAHLKKPGGGKPVTTVDELEKQVKEMSRKMKPKVDAQYASVAAKQRKKFKEETNRLKPLPRCREDRTETEHRKIHARSPIMKQTMADILFLPPGMKTTSPAEIYGNTAMIVVYDPNNISRFALMAERLDIPCLPYRKRHTGKYLFEHFGEHALRNYDGNPNGEGQSLLQ